MNTYELTFVVTDDIADENLGGIVSEVAKELEKLGGVIIKEDPWGKRRLAYPIKHRNNGYYVTFETHLESNRVKELDRYLMLHSSILRHLIVTALPQSLKTTDESELSESLERRVEEKIAKKEEEKPKIEEVVAPEVVLEKVEEPTAEVAAEKPKAKIKKVAKSNEEEKKEENAQERRKLVEEKLSEILKD